MKADLDYITKSSQSYHTCNLNTIITPEIAKEYKFIETNHLCTVIAIVHNSHEDLWLNIYERFIY